MILARLKDLSILAREDLEFRQSGRERFRNTILQATKTCASRPLIPKEI